MSMAHFRDPASRRPLLAGVAAAVVLATAAQQIPAQARGATSGVKAGSGGYLVDARTGDRIIRYVLRVPSGSAGKKLGLIVSLHGTDGKETRAHRSPTWALAQHKLSKEYAVMCLKSKGAAWEPVDDEPVRRALAWVLESHPIDPRRVYGWGFSAGGWFWGRFVPANPGLLAGAVLCAGGAVLPRGRNAAASKAPLYLIACELDRKVPAAQMRQARDRLRRAGYPFVYREIAGAEHNDSWNTGSMPQVRRDAMAWCHAVRDPSAPVDERDTKRTADALEKIGAAKSVSARLLNAVAAIGSSEATSAVAQACGSPSAAVRAAAAKACSTFFLPEATAALVPLLDDATSKKARSAAFDALGRAALWQQPAAQQALTAYARDPQRKATERVLAIQQLARLVPIELMSSTLNEPLFECLIGLLMDPEATVRKQAFAALMGRGHPRHPPKDKSEPPSAHGFRYSPKASESKRAEAQERWTQWVRQVNEKKPNAEKGKRKR